MQTTSNELLWWVIELVLSKGLVTRDSGKLRCKFSLEVSCEKLDRAQSLEYFAPQKWDGTVGPLKGDQYGMRN